MIHRIVVLLAVVPPGVNPEHKASSIGIFPLIPVHNVDVQERPNICIQGARDHFFGNGRRGAKAYKRMKLKYHPDRRFIVSFKYNFELFLLK